MTSVTIYHNPRCSKSRASLALIEANTSDFRIKAYLEEPLTEPELKDIVSMLNCKPIDIVRQGEEAFTASGLTSDSDAQEIYAAILQAPILLQRPIVVSAGKAAVGRPPEAILDIIQ